MSAADEDLSLQDLLDMLPQLVNGAVRAMYEKPPLPQHGLVSIKTGVVVSADSSSALVQLDDEPADNPVSVQLATLADISDRVIVFTRHGGGAYAIGNGQAATSSATGVQSVVAGTGISVDDTDPQNPIVAATGGASTFPITENDGNATYTVSIPTPQEFQITTVLISDPSYNVLEQQIVTGGGSSWVVAAFGGGNYSALTLNSSGEAILTQNSLAVTLLVGTVGDPNGIISASRASMYFDISTGNIYRNTDNASAWTAM